MKLYQKLESASFKFPQQYWEDIELVVNDGEIWLSVQDDDYLKEIDISEEKLIQLRNFLNSLLEEV